MILVILAPEATKKRFHDEMTTKTPRSTLKYSPVIFYLCDLHGNPEKKLTERVSRETFLAFQILKTYSHGIKL